MDDIQLFSSFNHRDMFLEKSPVRLLKIVMFLGKNFLVVWYDIVKPPKLGPPFKL